MDRQTANAIRDVLRSMAPEIEKRLNGKLKVTVGGGRFDTSAGTCSTKLEFADVRKDGSVASVEEAEYQYAGIYFSGDAPPLGTQFTFQGQTYAISGLKSRSRKMPILAKCVDNGKTYKFSADTIERLLGRKAS